MWLLDLRSKCKQTNKNDEPASKGSDFAPQIGHPDSLYEKEAETWATTYTQHNQSTQANQSPQEFLSSKLKFNFGNIQIHADNEAANTALQYNAQAFTYGENIYFAQGKYEPQTLSGRQLIAHELTHVVQQNTGIPHQIQRQQAQPELETEGQLEPKSPVTSFTPEYLVLLEKSRNDVITNSAILTEQVNLYRMTLDASERLKIEKEILLAEQNLAKSLEIKIKVIEPVVSMEPNEVETLKKELDESRSDLEKLKRIFIPEVKTAFETLYSKAGTLNCMGAAYMGMGALFGSETTAEIRKDVKNKADAHKKNPISERKPKGENINNYITVMETVKERGRAGDKISAKFSKSKEGNLIWSPPLQTMILQEVSSNMPGYYFFGLSIADAFHSVILMVDNRETNPEIYWYDQFGIKKVSNLDDKVNNMARLAPYVCKETAIWPLIPPPDKGLFKSE